MPTTGSGVFKDSYVEYAILYVPTASIDKYKAAGQWKDFGTIKSIEGNEPQQCATPVIYYSGGKLVVLCATEGAKIHYSISANIEGVADNEETIDASCPKYIITAYATVEGYRQSDTATKEFEMKFADVNGDGSVDISDVNAVISVICGNE